VSAAMRLEGTKHCSNKQAAVRFPFGFVSRIQSATWGTLVSLHLAFFLCVETINKYWGRIPEPRRKRGRGAGSRARRRNMLSKFLYGLLSNMRGWHAGGYSQKGRYGHGRFMARGRRRWVGKSAAHSMLSTFGLSLKVLRLVFDEQSTQRKGEMQRQAQEREVHCPF
jgi:hypothetical protein